MFLGSRPRVSSRSNPFLETDSLKIRNPEMKVDPELSLLELRKQTP